MYQNFFFRETCATYCTKLAKLPFGIGEWIGLLSGKIKFGNLKKYGLPISKIKLAVLRKIIGKTPIIYLDTIAQIKAGKIKIHRDIEALTANSVQFKNGTEKQKGLFFIGYEKYSLGGILGTLKDDSLLILNNITIR